MMKMVKVKLIGSGTMDDPFRVNLPTFVLVDADYLRLEATVLVPEDEVDDKGCLNEVAIRRKYKEGWSRFRAADVTC